MAMHFPVLPLAYLSALPSFLCLRDRTVWEREPFHSRRTPNHLLAEVRCNRIHRTLLNNYFEYWWYVYTISCRPNISQIRYHWIFDIVWWIMMYRTLRCDKNRTPAACSSTPQIDYCTVTPTCHTECHNAPLCCFSTQSCHSSYTSCLLRIYLEFKNMVQICGCWWVDPRPVCRRLY